jgi:hypothetical protein
MVVERVKYGDENVVDDSDDGVDEGGMIWS